jgi:hypothetical protein
MMRFIALALFLTSAVNLTLAETVVNQKSITISEYKVKEVTVMQSLRELNKLIRNKYPDRPDLLVVYLPSSEGKNHDQKVLSLSLINNPPVEVILDQIAQLSGSKYKKDGSRFILYDWTRS